jgi:hypothetical protein
VEQYPVGVGPGNIGLHFLVRDTHGLPEQELEIHLSISYFSSPLLDFFPEFGGELSLKFVEIGC